MAGLDSFISGGSQKSKLAGLFSKGVGLIYADALEALTKDAELLDKVVSLANLPPEITMQFLEEVRSPKRTDLIPQSSNVSPPIPDNGSAGEAEEAKVVWKYLASPSVGKQSFLNLFASRYRKISRMLWSRPQLKSAASISNIRRIRENHQVTVIGLISNISTLKDGRKILEVEDPTGSITVLVQRAMKGIDELVLDEVVGVVGRPGRDIIFAENIFSPDIPSINNWPENAKSKAVFVADIHAGSKKFNENIWIDFVKWVNQRKDIKYIFVGGDLVDGVGIYKGQDKEIDFETVEEEFQYLRKLLDKISPTKRLIVIPGNHDPTNDSEPRQPIPREFAKPIYQMPNVQLLSDPAWVNVEGVCILMYHGTSFDGLISSTDSIRENAYDRPTLAQKLLLKKRHLSPIFGRNRVLPNNEDHLVIQQVPHVFFTGHVHTVDMSNYRGVRLVSAGSFQERTDFQKKLGHHPTPGRFVEMDLSTGESKIIDFSHGEPTSMNFEN